MAPRDGSAAFAGLSTFTPVRSNRLSKSVSQRPSAAPKMVAPKDVRRKEEIKRLTKQLEELRAARERMASEGSSGESATPPAASPPAPAPVAKAPELSAALASSSGILEIGRHGEGSRFLSMMQVGEEECYPRIFTVAGRVPELTVKELLDAPPVLQNRAPSAGNLFITMLPEGYDGQIMALPGLELTSKCRDPVVVLAEPKEVSAVDIPIEQGDDLVLLVERNLEGMEFSKNKFYLWDVEGKVRAGWAKDLPPGDQSRCLGQVLYGTLQVRQELRKVKSCFAEENETYAG